MKHKEFKKTVAKLKHGCLFPPVGYSISKKQFYIIVGIVFEFIDREGIETFKRYIDSWRIRIDPKERTNKKDMKEYNL